MTGPIVGQQVRIRPGLRDKPTISGREGVVVELVNDRLRVRVGTNQYVVERNEVIQL
jgi:hypothetical protein